MKERSGAGKAAIFRAHAEFLEDPELAGAACDLIRHEGRSAGWAWQRSYEARADTLATQKDPRTGRARAGPAGRRPPCAAPARRAHRGRAAPARHPGDPRRRRPDALGYRTARPGLRPRLLHLCRRARPLTRRSSPAPWISRRWSGRATRCSTSRTISGGARRQRRHPGDRPHRTGTRRRRSRRRRICARQREAERRACYQPAIMVDGARIEVVANIGGARGGCASAVEAGGEGVGLLRTEFLFLGREQAPSEDEQAAAYTTMTKALNGLPHHHPHPGYRRRQGGALHGDAGGGQPVPRRAGDPPCLDRPELFRTQLRAIFRAAATGPVRIMFPMISTLDELARGQGHRGEGARGARRRPEWRSAS